MSPYANPERQRTAAREGVARRRGRPKSPEEMKECECGCGTSIPIKARNGGIRKYVQGHQHANKKSKEPAAPDPVDGHLLLPFEEPDGWCGYCGCGWNVGPVRTVVIVRTRHQTHVSLALTDQTPVDMESNVR